MSSPAEPTAAGEVVAFRLVFGRFEFDPRSGELRKAGSLVRLRQQPSRVLGLLLSRPGDLVTREELRSHLWSDDTFVDFDQGLNYCIKEIRAAIGDRAVSPSFLETLPRRGYRWIGPVGRRGAPAAEPVVAPEPRATAPESEGGEVRRPRAIVLAAAVALALVAVGWALWPRDRPPPAAPDWSWRRVTFKRGWVASARFAPTGEVVYTAAWDGRPSALYSGTPGAPESAAVRQGVGRLAGVSARGDAFYLPESGGEALYRSPLGGGEPKEVLDGVLVADAGHQGGDVAAVVRQVRDGKGAQVEFPPGRIAARLNSPGALRVAPDGRRLAVVEHPVHGDDAGHVLLVTPSGERRAIGGEWTSIEGLAWAGAAEIWVTAARRGSDTSLYAIRADTGEARLVFPGGGRLVLHDMDSAGRLLVERALSRPQVFFGREGEAERELTWLDGSWPQDLTDDGATLLMTEGAEGGGPDYSTYLRPTDGSLPVRIGDGRAVGFAPDGRSVLIAPSAQPDGIRQVPIRAGQEQVHRVPGIASYLWAQLLPDGALLFSGNEPGRHMRVWLARPGGAPRPLTPEQIVVRRRLLSPDTRWLVAACPPARTCLYPTAGAAPVEVSGLDRARPLSWHRSGLRLFVAERAGNGCDLLSLDPWSGRRERIRHLAPADPVGAWPIGSVLVTPDGRAWAYGFLRRLSELYVVEPAAPGS